MSTDRNYRDLHVLADMLATMNDGQIGRHFGVSPQNIRYWRRKHGLPLSVAPRQVSRLGNRKYTTDREFFRTIDTEAKAYVLGFVIADGSIHPNGKAVDIAIKVSDAPLLQRIADELGSDAPIGRKVSKGFDGMPRETAILHLCGRALVADLASLGVGANKSQTAIYPSISMDLERHLARGLMDGDGYIGPRQFNLVGTQPLVEGFTDAVRRHTGCALALRRQTERHVYAYGYRRDADALRWMYEGGTIALSRKADAFRDHWMRPDVPSL